MKSVDKSELHGIIEEQGAIVMNCQMCNTEYRYDKVDVEAIHAGVYGANAGVQ